MFIKNLLKNSKKLFLKNTEKNNFLELQKKLSYHFENISLLEGALTHKSFANEMNHKNYYGNERLEFLGDAVLELVISHILMERFQNCSEGKLSNMRAAIVNKDALSSVALRLDISKHILLSRGENENKGRKKKSILSNVYEAIIAAVYYDGGYNKVFNMIEIHFSELLAEVAQKGFYKDYKSRLQEFSQRMFNEVPQYEVLSVEGPDHKKVFNIEVVINKVCYEKAHGASKKEAEQSAAKKTLEGLMKD